jgi:hypothetical protein
MFHRQQVPGIQQQEQGLWLLRRIIEASRHHMVWKRVRLALQIVDQPAGFSQAGGGPTRSTHDQNTPIFAHLCQNGIK